MSAYAHQMEREVSGLSSRGNSEMGSRFSIDSGCYMTSLAATIFIASLVTFGVLMITLLIAISTMLQSCENRNSGIAETQRLDDESFSYCKILSLHSQLNRLEEEEDNTSIELPLLCRDVALRRIKQGIYLRDLNFTIQMALTYFQTIKPMKDNNRDVVVIDIDEINLLEQESYIEEAKHQRSKLTLGLYYKLRSQGYSMVLFSRRPETERNSTAEQLKSRGYSDWSHLIMREDTRQKEELERGYRVIGVIGNHMDVLTGQWNWESKRLFKLPSLTYNDILSYIER